MAANSEIIHDIPEIIRIQEFLDKLEEELYAPNFQAGLSENISFIAKETDSDDEFTLECERDPVDTSCYLDDAAVEDFVIQSAYTTTNGDGTTPKTPNTRRYYIDTTTDSVSDDINNRTPSRGLPSLTDIVRHETPHSKVDAFFEILQKTGYYYDPVTQTTTKGKKPPAVAIPDSAMSKICQNYFFDSAHSPTDGTAPVSELQGVDLLRNDNSSAVSFIDTPARGHSIEHQPLGVSRLENHNISFSSKRMSDRCGGGVHIEFTPESLKQNWDLEDLSNELLDTSVMSTDSERAAALELGTHFTDGIVYHSDEESDENDNEFDVKIHEEAKHTGGDGETSESEDKHGVSSGAIVEPDELTDNKDASADDTLTSINIHDTSTSTTGLDDTSNNAINNGNHGPDLRLHGDFSVWITGNKCTVHGIRAAYIGLYNTALTHNLVDGILIHADSHFNVSGGVNSGLNDSSTHSSGGGGGGSGQNNIGVRSMQALQQKYSTPPRALDVGSERNTSSSSSSSTSSVASKRAGYYTVHVMECVIRPDVLLSTIITSVLKVAKTATTQRQQPFKITTAQRSQVILGVIRPRRTSLEALAQTIKTTAHENLGSHNHINSKNNTTDNDDQHEHNNGSKGSGQSNSSSSSAGNDEFDLIDLQVCVSKELRQRVLLVQFFKKVPMLKVAALGGLILNSLTGSTVTRRLLKESPITRKFISLMKKELSASSLSLSSLYTSSLRTVCSLPTGLDTHFKAQLHTLVRDNMWEKLENDYRNMEDHIAEQEVVCISFRRTMEFMYKQYNISMPAPWTRPRKTSTVTGLAPLNASAAHIQRLKSAAKGGTLLGGSESGKHSPVIVTPSDLPLSPVRIRSASELSGSGGDSDGEDEGPQGQSSTSSPNRTKRDSYIDNSLSEADYQHIAESESNNTNSFNTVNMSTANDDHNASFMEHKVADGDVSGEISQNIQLQDSTAKPRTVATKKPRRKSTGGATQHNNQQDSSYITELMLMKKVDGMTFCLVMLDKCYQELQRDVDAEYSARLTQRNTTTVALIDSILQHKQNLLDTIANLPDVYNIPLMKSFANSFANIPITTSTAMHKALCSGNNSNQGKPLAGTKSWLMGGLGGYFGTAQNTVTTSVVGSGTDSVGTLTIKNDSSGSSSGVVVTVSGESPLKVTPPAQQSGWASLWGGGKASQPTNNQPQSNSSIASSTNNGHSPEPLPPPPVELPPTPITPPVLLYYCACMVSNIPATLYLTTTTVSIAYNNIMGNLLHFAAGHALSSTTIVARSGREIYPLQCLVDVLLPTVTVTGGGPGAMLANNTLKLTFNFSLFSVNKGETSDTQLTNVDASNSSSGGGGDCNNNSSSTVQNTVEDDVHVISVSPVAMDCVRLQAVILEVKRKFGLMNV